MKKACEQSQAFFIVCEYRSISNERTGGSKRRNYAALADGKA
jgi:hypothetical protein